MAAETWEDEDSSGRYVFQWVWHLKICSMMEILAAEQFNRNVKTDKVSVEDQDNGGSSGDMVYQ